MGPPSPYHRLPLLSHLHELGHLCAQPLVQRLELPAAQRGAPCSVGRACGITTALIPCTRGRQPVRPCRRGEREQVTKSAALKAPSWQVLQRQWCRTCSEQGFAVPAVD
jgi:hypothetical protein